MKKTIFILLLTCLSTTASAQFRMVSNGMATLVSSPTDSTYVIDVDMYSDRTGGKFNPTQTQVGYKIFTQLMQSYRITQVNSSTFDKLRLTVVHLTENGITTNTAPTTGQLMVYQPNPSMQIPQVPFGSSGASSALQAAVDTWNSRIDYSLPTDIVRRQELLDSLSNIQSPDGGVTPAYVTNQINANSIQLFTYNETGVTNSIDLPDDVDYDKTYLVYRNGIICNICTVDEVNGLLNLSRQSSSGEVYELLHHKQQ